IGPPQVPKRFSERRDERLRQGIVFVRPHEHADASHALALLRRRRERPGRRAPKPRHELAAVHSITSSASASRFGGISRPIILAVLRLMTNSNLVDCRTGKSAGLAPLRMAPA